MTTFRSVGQEGAEVQPLKQWPSGYERTDPEDRMHGPFKTEDIVDRTIRDLDHELSMLDAREVVVQLEVPEAMIRQKDLLPYERAEVDPGVVLTFENENGVQTYPCDSFDTWEKNLRAITLALRSLRRVSRYGVGRGSEQYRGYSALPADVDARLGPEQAARILASTAPAARDHHAGDDRDEAVLVILEDEAVARDFYREAAKRSHPDRTGSDAHFKRVQTASTVLDQYFKAGGGA